MYKLRTPSIALTVIFLACASTWASNPVRAPIQFLEAQRCRVNGTVDYGCFQQRLDRFEQFVLADDASWLEKSIVADALVKMYDALHVESPSAAPVRAKDAIYRKAVAQLDISERGEIDDCKDDPSPDGCLRGRYCFKEGYIKVKNVLLTNEPERFAAEIRWFDREIKGNC